MAAKTETQSDQMKRQGRRLFEIVNGRKLDALDEIYTTNVVWHGPGAREIRGIQGVREMINGYLTAFPDVRMTIEHQVAEGNLLATEWRAKGTHKGPLGDIAPTGKTVDIRGHVIARYERGKVVEEFEVFDELQMLRQIGAVAA